MRATSITGGFLMIGKRRIVAAAAAAGLAIGGGVAYATIPESSGVIHGCYAKNGALRVVDRVAGDSCRSNETALDWNQQAGAGAVAYAHVVVPPGTGEGVLDAASSKGVDGIRFFHDDSRGLSVYCFDLAVTASNVVASTDRPALIGATLTADAGCPSGYRDATAYTGSMSGFEFYILFH
jgi:hypothetical protein